MFEPIVRRGTLIAVAALIVCVLGLAAALRIPVQMIPDLEVRTITVRTDWRGATPRDIEQAAGFVARIVDVFEPADLILRVGKCLLEIDDHNGRSCPETDRIFTVTRTLIGIRHRSAPLID